MKYIFGIFGILIGSMFLILAIIVGNDKNDYPKIKDVIIVTSIYSIPVLGFYISSIAIFIKKINKKIEYFIFSFSILNIIIFISLYLYVVTDKRNDMDDYYMQFIPTVILPVILFLTYESFNRLRKLK